MKFLYSDTRDYIDPKYDFINDRNKPGRKPYWDDHYAHECISPAPYDGLLVAMSGVIHAEGVPSSKVRYSTAEAQRFLRDGARKFLRFGGPRFKDSMLMGDCGAFAYVTLDRPVFEPKEVFDFYSDGMFTHGVSPDHIIFECDITNPSKNKIDTKTFSRYEITLENAKEFFKISRKEGFPFEPVAPVQGWSPKSMAQAAVKLEKMGYKYLAIGGLVPLKDDVIHQILKEIRSAISPDTNIHLLGFAKAETIHQFLNYGITSFDSTSPLIKAFKDDKQNYFLPKKDGGLDYYAAIRIPQALENPRLMQGIKRGIFNAEDLVKREAKALKTVRLLDQGKASTNSALNAVMDYHQFLLRGDKSGESNQNKVLAKLEVRINRTLQDQPWKNCSCDICTTAGVEVIIFRASNRNKRRGFHNLAVYHTHLQKTMNKAK